MVISGTTYSTDLKIINGQVIPEWWRKSGHVVNLDDVEDILAVRPSSLIIGKGTGGLLKVNQEVKLKLKSLGIELIEELTASAVEIFNQMFAEGKNVAAGFHLTC